MNGPWAGGGPGAQTIADGTTTAPQFHYNTNSDLINTKVWTFSTQVTTSGPQNLPYIYQGFHSWWEVTVGLRFFITHGGTTTYTQLVSDGPVNCCTPPSGGFTYTGTQAVDASAGDTIGFELSGYNFDGALTLEGDLVVGDRLLLVSGTGSKPYGAPVSVTPVYLSVVGPSVDPATPATCSTIATQASSVGVYPVTCSGAADPSAGFFYGQDTLTITPVPLTVTGPDVSSPYGAKPRLSATYSGFVNGDTPASLTTQADCSTMATTSSPPGDYPTTCLGATDDNYVFTYAAGTLTVTAASLTVSAPSVSTAYGAATPDLAASYSGFRNGDTAASLGAPATCTTSVTAASPVGTYPITCSGAASTNYAFTYVDGTLTVTKAATALVASPLLRTSFHPTARLTRSDNGAPIVDQTVVFKVAGIRICSAMTNANGMAACRTAFVLSPDGFTAKFSGSANYHAATARGRLA